MGDVGGLLPGRQGIIAGVVEWGDDRVITVQLIVARVESSGEWIVTSDGNEFRGIVIGNWIFASCNAEGPIGYEYTWGENSVFRRRINVLVRAQYR